MPKFRIEAPDGKVFDVEGPEGSTAEQALAQVQATYQQPEPQQSAPQEAPVKEDSFLERQTGASEAPVALATGMIGSVAGGLAGLAQGAKNLVSPGMPAGDRVRQVQEALTYQPRSETGKAVTEAISWLPGKFAEFADWAGGGSAELATEAGASPEVAGAVGAVVNTAIQAAPMVLSKAIQKFGGESTASTSARAIEKAQNATRDATLKAGREAGLVVPPSTVAPGVTNQTLESVAGKQATAQTAAVTNARGIDTLARKGLELPPTAEITEQSLGALRSKYGQAYEAVKKSSQTFRIDQTFRDEVSALGKDFAQAAKEFPEIATNGPIVELQKALTTQKAKTVSDLLRGKEKLTPAEYKQLVQAQAGGEVVRETLTPTAAVELVKKLRFDAKQNYKALGDPEKAALADAQRAAANSLDQLIERNLTEQGKTGLSTAYKKARTMVARAHDVEAALQPDGHISGQVLNRIGQKGYLDGPLKLAADFSGTFPKATQNPATIGSPNVHNLRVYGSTMGAGIGAGMAGPVGAAVGAAIPWVAPPAVKGFLLSDLYQNRIANPSYGPSALQSILDKSGRSPAAFSAFPAIGSLEELQYKLQQEAQQ